MAAKIHRGNINRALNLMTKVDLAKAIGVSRPTLYKIIDGYNPHEGICQYINKRVEKLIAKKKPA